VAAAQARTDGDRRHVCRGICRNIAFTSSPSFQSARLFVSLQSAFSAAVVLAIRIEDPLAMPVDACPALDPDQTVARLPRPLCAMRAVRLDICSFPCGYAGPGGRRSRRPSVCDVRRWVPSAVIRVSVTWRSFPDGFAAQVHGLLLLRGEVRVCVGYDVSSTGARLHSDGLGLLPIDFYVTFDDFLTLANATSLGGQSRPSPVFGRCRLLTQS